MRNDTDVDQDKNSEYRGKGLWDQLHLIFKVRKWGNWVGGVLNDDSVNELALAMAMLYNKPPQNSMSENNNYLSSWI